MPSYFIPSCCRISVLIPLQRRILSRININILYAYSDFTAIVAPLRRCQYDYTGVYPTTAGGCCVPGIWDRWGALRLFGGVGGPRERSECGSCGAHFRPTTTDRAERGRCVSRQRISAQRISGQPSAVKPSAVSGEPSPSRQPTQADCREASRRAICRAFSSSGQPTQAVGGQR